MSLLSSFTNWEKTAWKSLGSSVDRPVHGPPQPWPHSSSKPRQVAPLRRRSAGKCFPMSPESDASCGEQVCRMREGNIALAPENSYVSVTTHETLDQLHSCFICKKATILCLLAVLSEFSAWHIEGTDWRVVTTVLYFVIKSISMSCCVWCWFSQ